jgi:hypothetical protein
VACSRDERAARTYRVHAERAREHVMNDALSPHASRSFIVASGRRLQWCRPTAPLVDARAHANVMGGENAVTGEDVGLVGGLLVVASQLRKYAADGLRTNGARLAVASSSFRPFVFGNLKPRRAMPRRMDLPTVALPSRVASDPPPLPLSLPDRRVRSLPSPQ